MLTSGISKPRLLFLAHLLPWPLNGGGQIKSFHTLRVLSSAFDITLLSFVRPNDDIPAALAALSPFCAGGIQTVPLGRTKLSNALAAFSASLSPRRSFLIARDDCAPMHRAVRAALSERAYTILHADHLPMMAFVPPAPETGNTRIVLDNHNIEHRIIQRIATQSSGSPTAALARFYAAREWPKLRDFERDACLRADCVLTVSDEDADGLINLGPKQRLADKIVYVPIGVDTDYFSPVPQPESTANTLLSIGTLFWPPNVDGAQWFCRDILPIIKNAVPNVQLHLVGARPNQEIMALAQNNPAHVQVFGSVPDVRPFAQCGAFVVPLRSGSGMRVKILNAFAMQLPVVSTTLGAEGIAHAKNGEHLLLADGPDAFAAACVRVLQNRAFAAQTAQAGRHLAETVYSWDAIAERLLSVYPCVNREGVA